MVNKKKKLIVVVIIILIFVLISFVGIYFLEKDKKINDDKSSLYLDTVKRNVFSLGEQLDISSEELNQAIKDEAEKEKRKRCNVSPLSNGICGYKFKLENKCCYPVDSTKPSKTVEKIRFAKDIIKEISISIFAGIVLENLITRGFSKRAATVAVSGAKTARTAASVAKAGRAVASGTRVAATATTKYSAAAAGGPPGWVVGAAMFAYDAIGLTLDLVDVDGYDSFTGQGVINKIRNLIDFSMAKQFEKEDMDYPVLFPLLSVYPEQMEAAMEYGSSYVAEKYFLTEMKKDTLTQSIFDNYVEKLINDPESNPELPNEITNFVIKLVESKHLDRDKAIYSKMKELLGSDAYKIALYESLSSPKTMAITLSRKGAEEWNTSKRDLWLANNDLLKPPDKNSIVIPDPPAACYTDTYYVYDSGPADKPVMVPKKLTEKTVLNNYYGCLVAFCEKVRQIRKNSSSVNPYELGTRFNFETGVCDFSKEMCRRYGLEFKDNDCKPKPGQNVSEIIFGKTVTRGVIREWDQRIDDLRSGDPGKVALTLLKLGYDWTGILTIAVQEGMKSYTKKTIQATKGACPSGMRDDGTSCWLDSYKTPAGSLPNACSGKQAKRLQRCYDRCPAGSTTTGETCIQHIHSYIPGQKCKPKNVLDFFGKLVKKCFWEPEPCDVREVPASSVLGQKLDENRISRKYLKRGTTCNEPCLPGFKFRSGAAGSAFCDKKNSSHSVKCPEGKEESGGFCYEPCKNKGSFGQYKYKRVLDWCHPEGRAGIKKTVMNRWECPAGYDNPKTGLCHMKCKPGERDDGLFCKKPD